MAKRKKQVYLSIYIFAKQITFRVSHKKPDVFSIARGEGLCFVFRMIDYDTSNNFYDAFESGEVMNQIGDFSICRDFDINKIIEDKETLLRQIKEFQVKEKRESQKRQKVV